MTPYRKTADQIARMRRAGLIVWQAHQAAAAMVEPGVATADIDAAVEKTIRDAGAIPLFKGAPGKVPFPASTCISVNSEVVHGIPGPRRLKAGDIVSIDIGARLDGWCGDAAVTRPVADVTPVARRLLEVTEGTLRLAIEQIGSRKRWSQIARGMERYVHEAGFAVVEELVGHGIGRDMWERPQVPNYYTSKMSDIKLRPGVVLAVEPMVNVGTREVRLLPDYWTIVTADDSLSAHFEHTLALTPGGVEVLTAGPDGEGWALSG